MSKRLIAATIAAAGTAWAIGGPSVFAFVSLGATWS